jgi:hypothetical protein
LHQPRSQEETPCTGTQEVSLETLLKKGREPIKSFDIFFKRNTSTTKKTNPRRLVPKRGAHFSQEYVLAKISNLTLMI